MQIDNTQPDNTCIPSQKRKKKKEKEKKVEDNTCLNHCQLHNPN